MDSAQQPGRFCPLAYHINPARLGDNPTICGDETLYVIGGLYGNRWALDQIEAMAAAELADGGPPVRLVFNGDVHWFNCVGKDIADLHARVRTYDQIAGNIEYELADATNASGCGCGYPDYIDDAVVARSNAIFARLSAACADLPASIRAELGALPLYRSYQLYGKKLVIVHGDAEGLAGWGFARAQFASAAGRTQIAKWFAAAGCDIFAVSHTCTPGLWAAPAAGAIPSQIVSNNGAAGLANIAGSHMGVITRIGRKGPWAPAALAETSSDDLAVSLVGVDYDLAAWQQYFAALWPAGSDGDLSYGRQIYHGGALPAVDLRLA